MNMQKAEMRNGKIYLPFRRLISPPENVSLYSRDALGGIFIVNVKSSSPRYSNPHV